MVIISARQAKFVWHVAFSICLGRLNEVAADIKDVEIEGRLISLTLLPSPDCLAIAGLKQ